MLGFLREKNPEIKMMYWNGPGEADPDLSPHKQNLVVDFYSATWGGTPEGLLAAGYELCNVSWRPLYVLPGSRLKALKQGRWIFDEFQLSRFGGEGPFGEPINARDCSKFQGRILRRDAGDLGFRQSRSGRRAFGDALALPAVFRRADMERAALALFSARLA